jgi:tetratricopeptide (TPR) repeat protein
MEPAAETPESIPAGSSLTSPEDTPPVGPIFAGEQRGAEHPPESVSEISGTLDTRVEIPPERAVGARPQIRRRSLLAWIALGILVTLGLAVGVGFLWLRWYENSSLQQAQAHLQAEEWEAAETCAEQALEYRSYGLLANPARLVLARGEARYHLGKTDLALADLEEGKAADPASASPSLLQAQIQFEQGSLDEALVYAKEAQQKDDRLGFPYALLALQTFQQRDFSLALTLANQAIERDSSQAIAFRTRGSIATLRGDPSAAIVDLTRALELQPGDVEALAWRAFANSEGDNKEDALKDAAAAQAAAEDSPAGLWAAAITANINKKTAESQAAINKAIELDGSRAEFYLMRAYCFHKEADLEKYRADLDKTLELAPETVSAIYYRALSYFVRYSKIDLQAEADRMTRINPDSNLTPLLLSARSARARDFKQSLEYVDQALAADPEDFKSYIAKGAYSLRLNEFEQAVQSCNRAIEIWEGSDNGLFCLAQIDYAQRNYKQSIEKLDKLIQQNPEYADAYGLKALALFFIKDIQGSQNAAQEAINQDPLSPNNLIVHAFLAENQSNFSQADADLNKALEVAPSLPVTLVARGENFLYQNQDALALGEARKALEVDPLIPDAYNLLFRIHMKQAKYADALEDAQNAVRLDPYNPIAYQILGQAQQRNGKNDQSVENLNKSLQLFPDNVQTLFWLERAHESVGDFETAVQDIKQYLQLKDQLTEDEINLAQDRLDFLVTIPKAVNGQRTVVDRALDFSISYPITWLQQPLPNEQYQLYLVKTDSTDKIGSSLMVGVFEFHPGSLDSSVSITALADYTRQAMVGSNSSYKYLSRDSFQTEEFLGVVDTFTMDISLEDGSQLPVTARYYYFKSENAVIAVYFISSMDTFAADFQDADKIVATLAYSSL